MFKVFLEKYYSKKELLRNNYENNIYTMIKNKNVTHNM